MNKQQIHAKLLRATDSGQMTVAVSWIFDWHGHNFDFYAGYAFNIKRWYLTGPKDWYQTREGITTERLAEILADPEVRYLYFCGTFKRLADDDP